MQIVTILMALVALSLFPATAASQPHDRRGHHHRRATVSAVANAQSTPDDGSPCTRPITGSVPRGILWHTGQPPQHLSTDIDGDHHQEEVTVGTRGLTIRRGSRTFEMDVSLTGGCYQLTTADVTHDNIPELLLFEGAALHVLHFLPSDISAPIPGARRMADGSDHFVRSDDPAQPNRFEDVEIIGTRAIVRPNGDVYTLTDDAPSTEDFRDHLTFIDGHFYCSDGAGNPSGMLGFARLPAIPGNIASSQAPDAERQSGRTGSQIPSARRVARDLAACDAYVSGVRRRRVQGIQLQRSRSPRFEEFAENFRTWLQEQEDGAFGTAMNDLREILDTTGSDDDEEGNPRTAAFRSRLVRQISVRCRP